MPDANAEIIASCLLLKDKGVTYIRAYVDLVRAAAHRAGQGDNPKSLDKSIILLESTFQRVGGISALKGKPGGHPLYALRSAMELATAHYQAAIVREVTDPIRTQEFEAASRYVAMVKSACIDLERIPELKVKDGGTRCNALILESRLLREQGKAAESLRTAQECRVFSKQVGTYSQIEATISLAEAHYYNRDYLRALKLFESVRNNRRARTNPKIMAVCVLQMARCQLRLSKPGLAEDLFSTWTTSGGPGQGNSFVRRLAAEVTADLEIRNAPLKFTPDQPLKWEDSLERLKAWLVTQALSRNGDNKKRAAALLQKNVRTITKYAPKALTPPSKSGRSGT